MSLDLQQESHRLATERARLVGLHRQAVALADSVSLKLVDLDRKMGYLAELIENSEPVKKVKTTP